MITAVIGFLIVFVLIFLRVPIAIALGIVGFGGFWMLNGQTPAMSMVAITTTGSTMSYYLAVVPLFVLMGNLVAGAGISAELYRAAQVFIGHLKGGLAIATVASCGGLRIVHCYRCDDGQGSRSPPCARTAIPTVLPRQPLRQAARWAS
jgi:TRAP-type mannitol/chloroaromatic compound transport system permease large subunit